MEMPTVKCEVFNMRRRRLNMVDGETPEIKCVKRRRRVPTAAVFGIEDRRDDQHKNSQQQQQQQQVDQSTTSTTKTTTTIKRSSRFRGVSRHRWTGRYEAHLWDKASWNVAQKKKGKQVYLGAYHDEESAARAYDLAALKYWGPTTFTNFPVTDYESEIAVMQNVIKEEYLASLRRKSSGFSRGVSKYRGVARHHHNGRWEARIGRVFGNKYLYLGTYSTQEEAAHAYDVAAIEYRGINAVTNFDLSTYIRWLRPGGDAVLRSLDSQDIVTSQALALSSNLILTEEPEFSFHANPLTADAFGSLHNQEVKQKKSRVSSCTKFSSPTALSLLLRSSIFKDLVQKNSNSSDDETDGEDTRHQKQIGSDDECGGIFYEGIPNDPYVCSTSDVVPGLELQESPSSFYNQTRQSLWDDVLRSSVH